MSIQPTVNFNPSDPPNSSGGTVDLGQFQRKRDHDALVQWSGEKYRTIKTARSSIERQWYINLAFYFGKQYVQLITTSSNASGNNFRLNVPQAPPWRVRMVANKIRPIIRTELAKVTAQKPTATIYPASTEDKDIFAARAGEHIWESAYRQKKIKNILRRAMFWTLICGNGYIKDYWDPTYVAMNTNAPGDIIIVPETPFHVFIPDFREEDLEGQPYLIHASTKSPEWVNAHYGKLLNGKSVNPNTGGATDILENSFLNLVGASQLTKDSVLCLEVWLKPGVHKLFPNGGMFTLLGDQIVQMHDSGWPYKHNEYPFTKFDHIPTGKYYSDSVITDLIPLQKEFNRCYDSETQILTSSGWKNGLNLAVGDSVLTFDPVTKHMKFGPVREMFMKEYNGPVTVLEGAQISARTTPGHKWFVKSSEGYDKIVTKLTSDHQIPLCAPVDIEGSENYNLHKLVGLVLSDGRINKRTGQVLISQSCRANPLKCEEIEATLTAEGVNYSTYKCTNDINDYYIPVEYSWQIKAAIPGKRLTADYIMSLGQKGLQGLFDGLMLGDGMYEGNKGAKFYTSLESEADLFQMICVLLGKAAIVRKQLARSDWAVRPYQYIVQVKIEKFSKASVFRSKKADENYHGIIWCPTVDTGFVLVRRNGKAYISGNTRSQIVEAKNLMSKPKLMAYKGSINPAQITTEPGQVILVTPGFAMPTQANLPTLPAYVLEELNRCQTDMDDISGQHEITKGRVLQTLA